MRSLLLHIMNPVRPNKVIYTNNVLVPCRVVVGASRSCSLLDAKDLFRDVREIRYDARRSPGQRARCTVNGRDAR